MPKDPQSFGSQNLHCPFSVSQYYRHRRLCWVCSIISVPLTLPLKDRKEFNDLHTLLISITNFNLQHIVIFTNLRNTFTGLELTLQERRAMETMLRTHVHHLQEQVNSVSNSSHGKINQSKTEDLLRYHPYIT